MIKWNSERRESMKIFLIRNFQLFLLFLHLTQRFIECRRLEHVSIACLISAKRSKCTQKQLFNGN